jgi:hypothetical protein
VPFSNRAFNLQLRGKCRAIGVGDHRPRGAKYPHDQGIIQTVPSGEYGLKEPFMLHPDFGWPFSEYTTAQGVPLGDATYAAPKE